MKAISSGDHKLFWFWNSREGCQLKKTNLRESMGKKAPASIWLAKTERVNCLFFVNVKRKVKITQNLGFKKKKKKDLRMSRQTDDYKHESSYIRNPIYSGKSHVSVHNLCREGTQCYKSLQGFWQTVLSSFEKVQFQSDCCWIENQKKRGGKKME